MKRIEDMIPPSFKLLTYIESERLAIFMAGINDIETLFDLNELLKEGKIDKLIVEEVLNFHYCLILNIKEEFHFNQQFSSFFTLQHTPIYKVKSPYTIDYERIPLDHDNFSECNNALIRTSEAFCWANHQFAKMYGKPEQETEIIKPEQNKQLRENERQTFLKIIAGLTHIIVDSNIGHLKHGCKINQSKVAEVILESIGQPTTDENGKDKTQALARKISKAIEQYPNIK